MGLVRMYVCRCSGIGVICDNGNVVPPAHQLAVLTLLAVDICLEDLHHVFLSVRRLGCGAVAVGGDVERLAVAVGELHDVRGRGAVDEG